MANPALTDPPGELMYKVISLSGSSFARYKSCATRTFAISSLTSVPNKRIRSFKRRETTSNCPDSPATVGRGGCLRGGGGFLGSSDGSSGIMKGEVAADNADTADPLDLETWKADEVVAKSATKAKNLIEIILHVSPDPRYKDL